MSELPKPKWSEAWNELTGYVTEAELAGETINPTDLLIYMKELRRKALFPITKTLKDIGTFEEGKNE